MKTANNFSKIEKRPNGNISWERTPIGNFGGPRFQTGEDEYDISIDISKSFYCYNKKIYKLNATDQANFPNVSRSPYYEDYNAFGRESKSRQFRYTRDKFVDYVEF